ncbi:uncharacterized protein A1O9_07827 [Exophiala aquamarina CBS 119918]|uniref:U3 small nucleolar RNA-associated protein 10 n=1 Tax=Exophiala aquamarina CBS 119918 TaxID=1182545 RepID=A0A072P8S0_9EURO|nr:uncharacterized protein A1O9_07827 [Exophiala aquamarina CBS 119918]KEF56246.1 hypothetical protein A1O9_07827 [Exophiala aquamarina CBS 119918]
MSSAFAAQLRTIAENSTNVLNLRARREAHGESLIFEKSVAVKQDWDTIYQICIEGFQELCALDSRLNEFNQNLFSRQAKDQDRDQLSRPQNEALDVVIEKCLALIGGKLLLRPGVKAVEWLIRRFRVHFYNAGALLATFLPYHESPVFRNLLSIIPANKITTEWKFLGPYHKTMSNVPRHALVYNATHNEGFFSTFNGYVIRACQEGAGNTILLRFWGSMIVEAVTGRMNRAKSGRKEVQKQRQEDVLLKVLPLLIEGFEIRDCHELTMICFTISIVLGSNADLEDAVIDSLMGAVAPFLTSAGVESTSALTCLAIMTAQKSICRVSREVLQASIKVKNLDARLLELQSQIPVHHLLEALITSSLVGLKKKTLDARLPFARQLLQISPQILDSSTMSKLLALLLNKAQGTNASDAPDSIIRVRVIEILRMLNDLPTFSNVFSSAAALTGSSLPEVEAIIGEVIETSVEPKPLSSDLMDVDSDSLSGTTENGIEDVLANLPSQSNEKSFIEDKSPLFINLAQAFTACQKKQNHLQLFTKLPIWRIESGPSLHLYESFVLRYASGPFPPSERATAIASISQRVETYTRSTCQDFLPFLTILLADPAKPIRRAAATVMFTMHQHITGELSELGTGHDEDTEPGYDAIAFSHTKRIPTRNLEKLMQQAYIPVLEECILDPAHISKVLQLALDSTSPSISSDTKLNLELKKPLRHNLFDLLTSYAVTCPLLKIKTAIVELLHGVHKVGSLTTSNVLSPILKAWAALSEEEALAAAFAEGILMSRVDHTLVQLIDAQDKEAVDRVLIMLTGGQKIPRPALVAAFFDRIGAVWKDMRPEAQVSATILLFEMSFSKDASLARGSRNVLQTSTLSTAVLATILGHALTRLTQMRPEGPPRKRRRTSQGRESFTKDFVNEFDAAVSSLTFALEIVDNSKPENHPQLLANLFDLLVTLRRLKDKSTSDSPYLLTLCLSSILAILSKAHTSRKPNIDMSSIRADLVIECVRSSDSPQVQSTALLVAASLASLAPDRILHNIMPIFTFMGHNLFSQDDERSIYVTNQAIDQIIPPLVSTIQKQDARNLISSTSSLLSSFVTAYSHVPHHRRVDFYQRLLARLGVDDFAFAVISLLATSKNHSEDLPKFFSILMGDSAAYSQLLTSRKIVNLSRDIFSARPHDAEALLSVAAKSKAEKEFIAQALLETASTLLKSNTLRAQARRLNKTEKVNAERFRQEYNESIRQFLALIRDQKVNHPHLTPSTRNCLSSLLDLPSLQDFLNTMPSLLQDLEQSGDQELQVLALRVLATQLQHNAAKDSKTNSEAVAFLPTLELILTTTVNEAYRHAAIACLDRIVELYGRKNPDSILKMAHILVEGDHGLSSTDFRTQVMSMLCLASMMEVLKETAVPIIPPSMSKVLAILKNTTAEDGKNTELHTGAFALLSEFVSHIPFMLSDENVVEILRVSYDSARADLEASCTESRKEALSLVAHKLDINIVTTGLNQASQQVISESAVEANAFSEFLDVLQQAIERSPKSLVVKSADSISTFLQRTLDLRRLSQITERSSASDVDDGIELSDNDISSIESKLHTTSIAFIYKLNDTAFRPVFESWIDWATKGADLQEVEEYSSSSAARVARMASLFNLLGHFFNTLKSIVTSYTSYILEPANEVLQETLNLSSAAAVKPRADSNTSNGPLGLYMSTLTLLTATLTHDADGFFTAPSHFQPLCTNLVSQFTLLNRATKSKAHALRNIIQTHVPTTLIALAKATIDTPAHHHALNHLLCQMRHNDSAAVRLAGIRLQVALTEDEDVGDEWVSNVVVGTATEGVGGSGETMVYVNESLEDDDESVEAEVRKWVRLVRERAGEDVFEV